jgi:Right handed beta helix region
VTVSGFGFSGPGVEVGGLADAPAGSNAVISHSTVILSANANAGLAAVLVGGGGNANSATIDHSFVDGQAATYSDAVASVAGSVTVTQSTILGAPGGCAVCAAFSGFADVEYNSVLPGPGGAGLFGGYGGSLVALHNIIIGSTSAARFPYGTVAAGVLLEFAASATVSDNTIGQFECEYNPTYVSEGLCGPDWATQYQAAGIYNFANSPGPFIETNNLIYSADVGVLSFDGCPQCVVTGNVVVDPIDYGLDGIDGSYSFGPDVIIGGAYGVGAIAYSVDTTVTLSQIVITSPSVAPFYYEIDFSGGTATITGTWIVLP